MSTKDLFAEHFSLGNLKSIFDERISQSHTVGKDGIHPYAFQQNIDTELALIRKNVFSRSYKFTSFKQRLILKGAGKPPREISIAGVRDRVTLRALNNCLSAVFVQAKQPLPHQFISKIKDYIGSLGDDYSFVQLDVQDFYPSLVHDELLTRLRVRIRDKDFLALVLGAVRTPTGGATINERGVPQGLSISNVLSSIYMSKIDSEAQDQFGYFRYVDDILIICKTANAGKNLVKMSRKLARIGLKVHPNVPGGKTKIAPLSYGVEYLGYHITPSMISVRRSSYRRMMEKIMAVMTSAKHKPTNRKALLKLNLKITGCIVNGKRYGWMFFFSMSEDIKQLSRLDRFVTLLWKKYGMEKYGKPKTFVKAYHEIKFNVAATKYIPKFDDYTMEQKMQFIGDILNIDPLAVQNWTQDEITKTFKRLIKKEVTELEKDITPVS